MSDKYSYDNYIKHVEELIANGEACDRCGCYDTEISEVSGLCEKCGIEESIDSMCEKTPKCINCGKEVSKNTYKEQIEYHKKVIQGEDCCNRQEELYEYFKG